MLSSACESVLEIGNAGNLYIDEHAPWSLFKKGGTSFDSAAKDLVIILEAMRIIAVALSPVAPNLCLRIYQQLGYTPEQFNATTWVFSLSLSHHCVFFVILFMVKLGYSCLFLRKDKSVVVAVNVIDYNPFKMQNDTQWGGLKSGQIMAPPNPIFARIEIPSESEGGTLAEKKVSKKKEKLPRTQTQTQTTVGA